MRGRKGFVPYKKQAPIVRVPRQANRNWSTYQSDVFRDVEKGEENLAIMAVPGSGKTTTIVESLYHLPQGLNTIFLAFNKSIARELEARVPQSVETKTTHSFGLCAITNAFGKVEVDNKKGERIATALVGGEPEKLDERNSLMKAMDLCKAYLSTTSNDIDVVIDKHELDVDDRAAFITNVQKGLEFAAEQRKIIDFSDMLWFVPRHNLSMPKMYDRVFCDEVQDFNAAQLDIITRMVRDSGRTIVVGDPRQSIFGFRGADMEAMENVIKRTQARVLPLSISYRCAKRIVELAQTIEPKIQPSPTAEEGVVDSVSVQKMLKDASSGDFIISRTNAPLIGYCLQFLKEGRKANIQGRDVGRNLLWMIKKSGASTVQEFLAYIDNWKDEEILRLSAKNRETAHISDRAECFYAFAEGTNSLAEMKTKIEEMFDDMDDHDKIILTTTHRCKGLERERAWVLSKTYKPTKSVEEANLCYVAWTRAKRELMLVS